MVKTALKEKIIYGSKLIVATLFLVLIWMLSMGVGAAKAETGPWHDTDFASLRIVSAVDGVGALKDIPAGLEFQMQPGWKIYWRTPGDAGFPPYVDWSGSENVKEASLSWPTPERFSVLGLETLGYKEEVVLPLNIVPENPGEPVRLLGAFSYLTCDEICVPVNGEISLDLAASDATPAKPARLINRYKSKIPLPIAKEELAFEKVAVAGNADAFTLTLEARGFDVTPTDLFVEGPENSWFTKPEISRDGDLVVAAIKGNGVEISQMMEEGLRLTVVDPDRAFDVIVTPFEGRKASGATPIEGASTSLLTMIAFAILGGLILNVMPCVLPVLSIKIMGALKHSGQGDARIRAGFLASSAGILTAFLMIGGILIAMQQAGLAIGWGIQFQQPVFLTFMILLLSVFAANMMGFFEISLPGYLANFAGQAGQERSGLSSDFVTGMFATLLATPCSAPFLGTAVGFALSSGPAEILMIFASLGLGLAIPYLLVAAFPRIAHYVPKPGRWMLLVKMVLGLLLLATALWLAFVLAAQISQQAAFIIIAFAALAFGVLTLKKNPSSRLGHHAGFVVSGLMGAGLIFAAQQDFQPATNSPDQKGDLVAIDWQAFDPKAISNHVDAGKTVFVDVTADWCITCQFNKKRVMGRGEVANWLVSDDVIAMKADWTRPDPVISDYLASFGRYGIPFNIIYGPNAKQGLVMSEILESDAVMEAASLAGADMAPLAQKED